VNVGLVTTWFERGAAYVSRAYRDVLAVGGHKVFIYARGGEAHAKGDPRWDSEDVTWGRSPAHGPQSAVLWTDFRKWALGSKLDMLVFNEQWDWTTIVLARRHLPVVLGSYVDYYKADTVRFFDLFDFLLCNTKRHHGVFKHHRAALYIPWGTDIELFRGDCQPVSPGTLVFFHSAGMNPVRKGTLQALRAFAALPGNCRFILHLQRPLADFPEIAAACQADPRVQVINKTVPAPGLYHLGDIYVYPTILEGIGLTIAEALTCGLPVITTDCPPMSEFVVHGENGFLVRPFEYRGRSDGYYWATSYCRPEDILTGMRYYLNNAAKLGELKRAARDSAVERFDWKRNSADLPKQIEELASWRAREEDLAALEQDALAYGASFFSLRRRLLQAVWSKLMGRGPSYLDPFLYG
jgi:1,2-diacylglycerol 3-alpha-glucosyltransferase